MMIFLIWGLVILGVIGVYLRSIYTRFSNYGVKHNTPVPLLGDLYNIIMMRKHFAEDIEESYKAFPGERYIGKYQFLSVAVLIKDLELLKKVAIKDFDHFADHRVFIDDKTDPLFGRNLFSLRDQEWRDMRSTLSPAFTSSKMRHMMPFMVEVGEQMVKALKSKVEYSDVGYIDIEGKDLSSRFSNDVIASCAFGLKVDSHCDEDNEFYVVGKEASTFKFKQFLVFMAAACLPKKVLSCLNISLFSESTKNFFRNLVLSTMRDREDRHIYRPDMIHLLMEAKKGRLIHEEKSSTDADAGFATVEESLVGKKEVNRIWSDDDLTAQAVLFFIAGFETVSTAMTFTIHELALNPEVQEKLYQEIKETDAKNGGKFDYTTIQQMTYMDMVISEVLRLWPPAVALDRICIKDYNLGKPNNKAESEFVIRKGEGLILPVWAYHRDPDFFPNPLKFDPERFSEQNKHNIDPLSYMPFGLGPRNCIGSRFALCEVKVMIYQLIKHMVLYPGPKTQTKPKLSKDNFSLKIEGGHWVRMKSRN